MNIYGKLAECRKLLQESNLQKTGKGFKFTYFELADFLPRTTELFAEAGLASFTTITTESAKMTIADDDGGMIEFEIPFAEFKGDEKRQLQSVQELGGTITYLTRYLWTQVMNIVEPDTVDRQKEKANNSWEGDNPGATNAVQKSVNNTVNKTDYSPVSSSKFEKIWWDGQSPIKQYDHFMVGDIEYKTMKKKADGSLFGLAVDENIANNLKYYDFQ